MIETLFGSTSPMWTTMPAPFPATGWLQPPVPLANGGYGAAGLNAPQLPLVLPTTGLATSPVPAQAGTMSDPYALPTLLAVVAQRRGQPMGPTTDQEVEDFIYDALEWLNGASDVEVKCDGARVVVTGSVPHKRLKRDVGEVAWAIPVVNDVQNNLTITTRRRARGMREGEAPAAPPRKQP